MSHKVTVQSVTHIEEERRVKGVGVVERKAANLFGVDRALCTAQVDCMFETR